MPEPAAARDDVEVAFERHGTFVRDLARRLCRDDAAAEDLAQDTWAVALRRPDVVGRVARDDDAEGTAPARGWLARVTRRLAGKRGRSDRARRDREVLAQGDVARAEEGGAEDAALARTLVLRDLADALVTLDPDSRRLVLARHFEGLELVELAQREGIAVSTLKSRLAAAYGRLRACLDARHGGSRRSWAPALAAATGLPVPLGAPPAPEPAIEPSPIASLPRAAPGPSIALTRGPAAAVPSFAALAPNWLFTMGLATKLGVVAAAGAVVLTGLALRGSGRSAPVMTPELDPAAASADEPEALHAAVHDRSRVAGTEPEAAAPGPLAVGEAARTPATFELEVTDLDGAAAEGVEVLAGAFDGPLNRVGRTDAQGRFALRVALGEGDSRLVFALRSRGELVTGLRAVPFSAGSRWRQRVALDPALIERSAGSSFVATFQERVGSGERIDTLRLALSAAGTFELSGVDLGNFISVHGAPVAPAIRRPGSLQPQPLKLAEGEVAFAAAMPKVEHQTQDLQSRVTALSFIEAGVTFQLAYSFEAAGDDADTTVRGVVRDVFGLPAAGAQVLARWRAGDDVQVRSAVTDEAGWFSLTVRPGAVELVAGSGRSPGSKLEVEVSEGEQREFALMLDRGLALVGRIALPTAPADTANPKDSGTTESEGAGQTDAAAPAEPPQQAPWRVEASAPDGGGEWLAIALTDGQGRYVVPHCPGAVTVELVAPESRFQLPGHRFEGVTPGGSVWELALVRPVEASLTLAIRDDAPDAVAAGELRIWDASRRRGAQRSLQSAVGSPIDGAVPPGTWHVQVGAAGPNFGPLRSIQAFDPAGGTALGPIEVDVALGDTAWVALPELPAAVWRVDRLVAGRAPSPALYARYAERAPLPPGEYNAVALVGEEVCCERRFTLVAGRTHVVEAEATH